MNILKLKNKIRLKKITKYWYINSLVKEESKFVEHIHTGAWNKKPGK